MSSSTTSTHRKNDHWLERHPKVRFHFTPTRASWLTQFEMWFSINNHAVPFAWTKAKVHQRRFKDRRISQL